MQRFALSLFVAATALISAGQAQAQTALAKYSFDKPHTQVMFKVNHMGFTDSWGRFLDYDGSFTLDPADVTKSTVDATIKTDSIDMGDGKWDEHLKSPDFFNVAKFPAMTFKSTKVIKTGEHTADVTGDLTILGVTKPAVLKVTHNKSGEHPMSKNPTVGFSATTAIKRSDFGMTNGIPMVGDDVTILLEVQGNQVADATKATKE